MASNPKIIARVKAAREELGWSQAELSRQMNQASNTIQKIESGFIKNPEKYLPQIAETTKKPLSYFYGEDNPELTQFAEKAKKFDALMEIIKDSGVLLGGSSDSSVNNHGGKNNVTVGGNGHIVNVNSAATKILDEIMKKDQEEHQLILKILELEKDEKDKLFQLYEVIKKKNK